MTSGEPVARCTLEGVEVYLKRIYNYNKDLALVSKLQFKAEEANHSEHQKLTEGPLSAFEKIGRHALDERTINWALRS